MPATDEHDFADALPSEERRGWQDPSVVVSAAGVRRGTAVDVDWRRVDNGFGPPVGIRLSESESRDHLRRAGFSEIKAFEAGPYHYGFVCSG
ncbi:MAG: hypothetical protein JRN63_00045 [Nitrososphaerota archaeon]|nr:hypothetical protein [Nitrososphaerota archaeon]